jgi:methionine-rich copper-binding protein CopC
LSIRKTIVCAVALLVMTSPGRVMAHADLEDISPGKGSRVTFPIRNVTLRFNEDVSLPRIIVRDSQGKMMKGKLARRSDSTTATFTLSTFLRRGNYRVQWKARSADGHWVSGNSYFIVQTTTP